MKHNFQTTFENVMICQLKHDDIELLRKWRNMSCNTKYLRKLPYITGEMQELWYQSYLLDESIIYFVIYENHILHRMVGSMALYNFHQKEAEFGKFLIGDEEAHGKNVGFHAIEAVKEIAKTQLGLDSIRLDVYEDNIAARKVYEKAGFFVYESATVDGCTEYKMRVLL